MRMMRRLPGHRCAPASAHASAAERGLRLDRSEFRATGRRHDGRRGARRVLAFANQLLHAPTQRTPQTLEALRRGISRALPPGHGVSLSEPRVEHAIRNPDLYVAGTRVEMVSSVEALASQLPDGAMTGDELATHDFFSRFWAEHDRIRVWLDDPDPPGERSADVARRFFIFADSLCDLPERRPRHYVCVTHSGPAARIAPRVRPRPRSRRARVRRGSAADTRRERWSGLALPRLRDGAVVGRYLVSAHTAWPALATAIVRRANVHVV